MELDGDTLERYRLKLRYKVCYHLGGFCPDIDDVVQESMARFLAAVREGKLQKPGSAGAFLNGICNHVIHEYQRRIWREESAEELPEKPGRSAPEAEAIEAQEAVAAAMAQLSERDRRILRAFYLEEQDKEEICEATGLSDAQFRVALFRAKDRFRKIYQGAMKRPASGSH